MVIKRLSIALKNVESWPKKLHQFFLGYIPTLGQVQYHLKMNLTPISLRSWLASLTKKYLPLQYYTCTEVQAGTTSCSKLTGRTSIILFQYIVSVLKQKELIIQKRKKVKGAFIQFIALSILTSDTVDSFLEVAKNKLSDFL